MAPNKRGGALKRALGTSQTTEAPGENVSGSVISKDEVAARGSGTEVRPVLASLLVIADHRVIDVADTDATYTRTCHSSRTKRSV